MMDMSDYPILNKLIAAVKKPSWAFPLLLFTLVVILSLQITTNESGFPELPVSDPGIAFELFGSDTCDGSLPAREFKASIVEFGGVGDSVTSNTAAFSAAMKKMRSFEGKGGALLNVPKGRWVTGSFNLTSNFTLFLEEGAVIMGSEIETHITALDIIIQEFTLRIALQVQEFNAANSNATRARVRNEGLRLARERIKFKIQKYHFQRFWDNIRIMRIAIAQMEMTPQILLAMTTMTQILQNHINLVAQDINQVNNDANAVLNASDQARNAMGLTFDDGTYNIDVDEVQNDFDTPLGNH